MSFRDVCRVLVREPFNLTMDQIADLSPAVVAEVYLYPDPKKKFEDGFAMGGDMVMDYQDRFVKLWKFRGKKDEEIKEKWKNDFPNRPWRESKSG